jgi:Flagellar protein FliT
MGPAAPWAELVTLAERELAAAREGRWADVAACGSERARRAASLDAPPPQARGELERLAALQDALVALVATARAVTARELSLLRRGRGAARGYAATLRTNPATARIDGTA